MRNDIGSLRVAQPLTILRTLWEDDRFGRVLLVMDSTTCARSLRVDIPARRTPAGEIVWLPLDMLPGADSEAVQALMAIIRELSGDVFFYTMPVREMEMLFSPDEPFQSCDL